MPPFDASDSVAPAAASSISSTLLERLKAGDQEAWRRWANLFGPVLYHWCRKSGLQASDAADVVQEVLISVVANLRGFDRSHPGDTFTGWVRTITRNKIRDHLRRRARQPTAPGGSTAQERLQHLPQPSQPADRFAEEAAVDDLASDVERCLLCRAALDLIQHDFTASTWQAFWRTAVDGQEAAAVGRELGLTKEAVRRAKFRVAKRLRRELAELP
jgi:RNA polymerase sigma-70 factor (ECF subfamily)